MKQPTLDGLAVLESIYGFEESDITGLKVANPISKSNLFHLPSLGEHYEDAKNMVALLQNMQSGMNTYCIVYDALERKYGRQFHRFFMKEVNR